MLDPKIVLSDAQIESIRDSRQRVNILDGSVRSGKTIAKLIRWMLYIDRQAPAQGELVMIGKTREAVGRNLLAPMTDPSLFGPLAEAVDYRLGSPFARIMGRTVHILGANDSKSEAKIRGMTVAGAAVDEASLLPRDFWNMLVSRMSVAGAKLFATTNPDNPGHWLRKDWIKSATGEVYNRHFVLDDNKALDADFVAFLKSQYVGLFYRRFILGEWIAAEGAIYDMWDPDVHAIDILPAIRHWIAVGIDYGTSNPFHALLIGLGPAPTVDPRSPATEALYVASEWRYDGRRSMRQLTDGEYLDHITEWLKAPGPPRVSNVTPQWTVIDPSAASFRAELKRVGWTQVGGDNAVLDGIRTVSTALARRKLFILKPYCPYLVDEMGGYSWDDDKSLLGIEEPIKEDDHGVDALRYGVKTTERLWRPRVDLTLPKAA